jgi:addiction module HigA family antidote
MDDLIPAGRPAFQPSHPGEILREDVFPDLGLTISEAARRLGISRQMLHRILAEEAGVTPEMALRIGKLCGNGPEFWLGLQQAHDLWAAALALADQIARIETMRAA